MSDLQKQYTLWDEFLTVWPASRLAAMTLEEYTQAGSKDSFTYWIESRLDELGSIWGGSSFKFGVFSRKDTEDKTSDSKLSFSDTHGWYSSLGATSQGHSRRGAATSPRLQIWRRAVTLKTVTISLKPDPDGWRTWWGWAFIF